VKEFPILDESNFKKTRRQFHLIAELIGEYRKTLVKPIAKNDNLWLSVVENGFCTPPINEYNELEIGCNPEKLIVEVANNKNLYESININRKTTNILNDELSKTLDNKFGVSAKINATPFDYAQGDFNISEKDASDFSIQLVNFDGLLRAFHKGISVGVKSQICLWPHHFDNAFKWFSGRKIDDEDEQMGIGVSNGDDNYELPYIYISFRPPLRKTNTLQIAEGAVLHDTGWTGLMLPYESLMEKKTIDAQKKLIEDFFNMSFASVQRGFSKR
jgi:hypothetical protein